MSELISKFKNQILILLSIIALISFIDSIKKGFFNSCDFQWQPAKLFWDGINHYSKFLTNGKYDFLCQGGEYGHLLNIIYYPFTLFEWEVARVLWLIVNCFFVILIPFLICKKFSLSKYKTIVLFLIFITCHPTRVTINYGQQSLLVMFFLILPFIFKSNLSILSSGISSVKYSSGYILFLNFLSKKEYKKFLLATIPYLIGWLIYFSYTKSDPLVNFFEPIIWSLQQEYIRQVTDIYTLGEKYFLNNEKIYKYLYILFIFIINFIILIKINKLSNNFLKLSLILICPLIFFPHSIYDYILLFPLACYSLLNFKILINKFNFYYVVYIFFLHRIIKHTLNIDWLYQPLLLLSLIIVLFLNIRLNMNRENKLLAVN
tara:strand:+ start:219 stop:1343 length:1125 start_codon:yes stop_codon:yes gene_type:complete